MNFTERVNNGAAWLDQIRPYWWKKIDIFTLDMSSNRNCVIGQMFGAFDEVGHVQAWIPNYGFKSSHTCSTFEETKKDYQGLTLEWKREILRRREVTKMMAEACKPKEPVEAGVQLRENQSVWICNESEPLRL